MAPRSDPRGLRDRRRRNGSCVHCERLNCFSSAFLTKLVFPSANSRNLMKKHVLIAATAALLAWPSLTSSVLAEPPQPFEDAGTHQPKFSPEDFAAFTDARIAA